MIPYIIINGVSSKTVKGLLIQSLPPISKPLMRTSIEEIDGRDGDIVTKLGYAAYDKTISIGLFGDYNVDDVISYFDTEGVITFSNELDKFYRFKILQQIDFEKLIRFKTATVTLHVQPFKYSAVDDKYTFSINELSIKPYTAIKNGVTIAVNNGVITLSGTATIANEFYLPINAMELDEGNYTLKALTEGTGESAVAIRVIGNAPSDIDSFGNTYLDLEDSGEATLTATLAAAKTFNYIWFYITSGTAMDFTLNAEMINNSVSSFQIVNRGNTVARPALTIWGEGTINLYINGVELFIIALGDNEYITIDGEAMNAYKGSVYMNRLVIGDYDNLVLKAGLNVISWSGNVTKVEVERGTRWI